MPEYLPSLAPCLIVLGELLIVSHGQAVTSPKMVLEPLERQLLERQPLILTPYVESGRIQEGQAAARVDGIMENLESYSGYFTVNTTYDRNLFLWYFPAEEAPATSPVVMWLQGGPGCSSMYALLIEHGPLQQAPNGSLFMRPTRWSRTHHMLYVDSPAGTGFSFPDPGNRVINEQEISSDLHNLLQQFFQLFPNLLDNDFYVAGESYAGYMVPSTGYAIHHNNASAKVKINLKGLLIGNGIVNLQWGPSADYLKEIGLAGVQECAYNYIHEPPPSSSIESFFNQNQVQERIHAGKVSFRGQNYNIYNYVTKVGDVGFKLAPILRDLLQHYPILYYSGQLDCVCPYPYAENFFSTLEWSGSPEYLGAERVRWEVHGELAGYIKTGGNLSVALVRNAGHLVPHDQPVWALDLITRFINKTLLQL